MSINFYILLLKRLYLWLALGFVIYIAWRYSSDFNIAIESLKSLSVGLLILCLTLAGVSYCCRSFRWLGYIRLTELKTPTSIHIIIYLSGFAFTASPGKAGELLRGTYLNDLGVSFKYTFLSFVSERLLDVLIVLFFGTYFLIEYLNPAFSLLSIVILLIPFIFVVVLQILLNQTLNKHWLDTIRTLFSLWQFPVALRSQLFTLLTWFAQGLILYILLINFDVKVSIMMAVSIYCLSLLIGAASLIPSGIGATEASMVWLLNQAGVDSGIAIIVSILSRIITLWPAMLIGLGCAKILDKSKAISFVDLD